VLNPQEVTMKVWLRQVDGLALAAKSGSNHWVTLDGPEEFGGHSGATRPMELILMGLAGCTSMDVLSILKKKRVSLVDFSVTVEAERADEHPKVFTNIKLHYVFTGKAIKSQDVERAIELSQTKYCGASAMLARSAEISYDYEIKESE
jgi:putative redox protein